MKFKTNIKCDGCVSAVTPFLNQSVGQGNWQVDLTNPDRILTVNSDAEEATVREALEKAGYKADKL